MQLTDLLFLAAVLLFLILVIRLSVLAILRRWNQARSTAALLTGFLCCYSAALLVTSIFTPRRFFAPGERHCFDDWCVAALSAEPAMSPGKWIVTFEVSSEARRVRQRASDAQAEVEDSRGRRYAACSSDKTSRQISDEVNPGDAFQVRLPFCLPAGRQLAGAVIRHGGFPGVLIIGDDQSFLHPPALLYTAVKN